MTENRKLERYFWRFWLGGLAILAVRIAMNPLFVNDVSPWGIRDHQSAGTAAHIDAIQSAWQAAGVMDYARLGMALDIVYIAIYSFGVFCGGRIFSAENRASLRWLGRIIMIAASTVAIADYIETAAQFVQAIRFEGNDMLAGLAARSQPIKSTAFLTSFFCILIALFVQRQGRRAD